MASRIELQSELETILGTRNVYFQPPESIKMNYPAIIYQLDDIDTTKSDNLNYRIKNKYSIKYVDKNPDNDIVRQLLDLPHCSYDRRFVADNLYQDVLTIYY